MRKLVSYEVGCGISYTALKAIHLRLYSGTALIV